MCLNLGLLPADGNGCEEILKRRELWEEIEWFKMKTALTAVQHYKKNKAIFVFCK